MWFPAVRNMKGNCLDKGNTSHNDKKFQYTSLQVVSIKFARFRLYSQHMVQFSQRSDFLKSDGLPQSEINDDSLSNAPLLEWIVPDSLLPCK